jgi:hypothetical protein
MTVYKKITLEQDLVVIGNRVRAARKDGSYAGLKARFDKDVLQTIEDGMQDAQANTVRHAQDVEAIRLKCKGKVDWAETQLKAKTLDAKEYTAIKTNLALVKKYVDELHELRREFAEAMAAGFRGGWPAIAKECLSDDTPYVENSKRKLMIDLDNKVSTMAKRCEEYVPRAAEYLKQTIQREKGGAVEIDEFRNDVETHLQTMTGHRDFVADKIRQMHTHVTAFEGLGKKKEKDYTADDVKFFSSRMAVLERAAKEGRGRLKTATIEHEGLERRAKSAGPGWKDSALQAVKDSDKVFKEIKKLSEELTGSEESARKLLTKVEKKVG